MFLPGGLPAILTSPAGHIQYVLPSIRLLDKIFSDIWGADEMFKDQGNIIVISTECETTVFGTTRDTNRLSQTFLYARWKKYVADIIIKLQIKVF